MKKNIHQAIPLTVVLAALAQPMTSAAQSQLWDAARERLVSLQAGKSPKTEPIVAQGAVEQWGEPPARGLDPQQRAAQRILQRDPKSGVTPAAAPVGVRREQRSDERFADERGRDDRFVDDRRNSERRTGPSPSSDTSTTAAKPRATRLSAEERIYQRNEKNEASTTTSPSASCVNVARAWEGAAALAERGQEERAYEAYLRLLGSCTNEKELLGTVYQAQKHLSAESLEQLLNEPLMESPKLQAAMYSLKLQRMYAANKARNAKLALTLARELRAQMLDGGDAGALEVAGWLEHRARNSKVAEQLFRAALKSNRDAEGAREGLVFALLAQSKVDAASREADRLEGAAADEIRAEVLLAQARRALSADEPAEALKLLDKAERLGLEVDDSVLETRAWALKATGQFAKAAKLFESLVRAQPDREELATGLVDSLTQSRDESTLKKLATGVGPVAAASKTALAQKLESQGRRAEAARLTGEVTEGDGHLGSATVAFRTKSGEKGEGRLTETAVPTLKADVKVASNVKVQVDGVRLRLDDGENLIVGHEARGRVVVKMDDVEITAGAGASRIGGSTEATFEAKGRVYTDSGYLEAGVSREPVRDSVRSYAGSTVTVAAQGGGVKNVTVGRVMDTQAYVAGQSVIDHLNRYNLNWQVGGGSVSGVNSPNNGYFRATIGVNKDIEDERFSWLNVGPYASFQAYERDENRFDGAYGGYFSPKSDVGLGMQLKAMTREGEKTLMKFSGQVGYVSRGLHYGNDSGVAVETGLEGAWLLGDHLILGAGVGLRTSPGYSDMAVRLGVSIPFEKRTKLLGSDLPQFRAQ